MQISWIITLVWSCDDQQRSDEMSETGIQISNNAVLTLYPESFVFPNLELNTGPVTRTIEISNSGEGLLKLTQFRARFDLSTSYNLYWDNDADESQVYPGVSSTGVNSLTDRVLDILPEDSITLILEYTPDELGANGVIEFQSNDADARTVTLPVVGNATEVDLLVSPSSVDFGRVGAGEVAIQEITVTNLGTADAVIEGLRVSGSEDFSIKLNGADPNIDAHVLMDPDQDGVLGISSRETMTFQVIYTPQLEGSDRGEVVILSNDSQREMIHIQTLANSASPCVNVLTPNSTANDSTELQFGPSLIGGINMRQVIIESCGEEPLQILDIRLETNTAYTLGTDVPPFFPTTLTAIDNDRVRPLLDFNLHFEPINAEVYQDVLLIESNDPVYPEIRVPVLGLGTVNRCPLAQVAVDRYELSSLEVLSLDASPSIDLDGPDGRPVRYDWSVRSQPVGSTAQIVESFSDPFRPADGGPVDDPTTPYAQFFVDIVGEYELELMVTDGLGLSAPSDSCQQPEAVVYIHALPDQDVYIELVWSTPNDRDEMDFAGADADLHLLHPLGLTWATSPYDCYYGNPKPDWGPLGEEGDPSLGIDDTSGAGPENINLNTPEYTDQLGENYRIGVHYYSDDLLGESEMTVRVYLLGSLAGEWTRTLNHSGNFWEVAQIIWTPFEQSAQEIDQFYVNHP